VKNRKTKIANKHMLRSIGTNIVRGICGVSPEEEKEGYGGKEMQKKNVLSLK